MVITSITCTDSNLLIFHQVSTSSIHFFEQSYRFIFFSSFFVFKFVSLLCISSFIDLFSVLSFRLPQRTELSVLGSSIKYSLGLLYWSKYLNNLTAVNYFSSAALLHFASWPNRIIYCFQKKTVKINYDVNPHLCAVQGTMHSSQMLRLRGRKTSVLREWEPRGMPSMLALVRQRHMLNPSLLIYVCLQSVNAYIYFCWQIVVGGSNGDIFIWDAHSQQARKCHNINLSETLNSRARSK